MRLSSDVIAVWFGVLASAIPATAAPILDQSAPAPVPGSSWGGGFGCPCAMPGDYFEIAQTFTVGLDGTLTRVEVYINSSPGFPLSPLLFDIRPAYAGLPLSGSTAMAHLVLPVGTVPGPDTAFFGVDLTPFDLQVATGQVLGIVLRAEGGNYGFGGQPGNPYAGGDFFGRLAISHPAWSSEDFDRFEADLAFRTFVEPKSVPAPGAGLLLALALGASAIRSRRRS